MTVKFETIAKVAPVGEYNLWVSLPSEVDGTNVEITWSSDKDGAGVEWPSGKTSYIGTLYSYLALGQIKVDGAGSVTITADAGPTIGKADITISFQTFSNPKVSGVVLAKEVSLPGDQIANAIGANVQVTQEVGGNSVGIAGLEVQWVDRPKNTKHYFYDANGAKLKPVRGTWWSPVLTGSDGRAPVQVTSDVSNMVTLQTTLPGFSDAPSDTIFFATTGDDFFASDIWPQPTILLDDGLLKVADGQRTFGVGLGPVPDTWAKQGNSAFFYINAGGADHVPWKDTNAQSLLSGVPLDLPLGIVAFSDQTDKNKAVYYVQNESGGMVTRSGVLPFGVQGDYENKPDPRITKRPLPAPFPADFDDPNIGAFIIPDIIENDNGLLAKVTIPPTVVLPAGSTVYFTFYINGCDRNGNSNPDTVTVKAVAAGGGKYTGLAPFPTVDGYYACGGDYGQLFIEVVVKPDLTDENTWIYSQYDYWLMATGK